MSRACSIVALLVLVAVLPSTLGALTAYMKIEGCSKIGEIKGGVTRKGSEGMIAVTGWNTSVVLIHDSGSGMATGRRQHRGLRIQKPLDKSSPMLFTVLVQNLVCQKVTLNVWTPNLSTATGVGSETLAYTIVMNNARIEEIEQVQRDNNDANDARWPVQDHVTFSYQRVEWTWKDGGITAMDDWEQQVV